MKVAVVADSHFDECSRFEECIRLHDWIAEDMHARGVQFVVHTGDVYERKSTPAERWAVARWFRTVAQLAPVLVVRGNHDAVDDLPLLELLDTRFPIVVQQEAGVHCLENGDATLRVAALAWPRKSSILSWFGSLSREEGEVAAGDAMRAVLRGLNLDLAGQGPSLFASHAMVRGSVTSTGQPLVGCDLEVGLEDLALVGADAYALGHVHKGQRWELDGRPVVYPGSPRRTSFGEIEPKGYTLLEWEELGGVRDTFIAAPATPMIHLEAEWAEEHVGVPGDVVWPSALYGVSDSEVELCSGAEVRFRYHTESRHRAAAREGAEEMRRRLVEAGAVLVKVEEVVVPDTRARTPEVARATTLVDKLVAFWESKGFDPGMRRELILTKANQLEEDNHAD